MKTSFEELIAFVSVVDTGSLTGAAKALGQTASGISRSLGRLEEKLDTSLLHRTTRRLELTEEGSAFLVHARRIVASIDAAEEDMAARREEPVGRLRINAASPFMLHVVVPLVGEFRARYPRIDLELKSDDQIIDLIEHRTDIALRIGPLKDSTLHARPLGTSRLRLLASPAYLERNGRPRKVADLARHALIGFTQPESLNTWPVDDADGTRLHVKPALRASSGETLRQLALEGAGVVCLSDFMTHEDRRTGALVQLLAKETGDERQSINAVYYRNTQVSSRIACFLDYLSARLRVQPWSAGTGETSRRRS